MTSSNNSTRVIGYSKPIKRSKVNRISRRFIALYERLDLAMAEARKTFDVSCGYGCSACCKQAVTISVFEAITILRKILYQPETRQSFLSYIYPIVEEQARACFEGTVDVQTWFEQQMPCCFLRDDLCHVYDVRPAVCRTLAVVTPPNRCAPPRDRPIQKVRIHNWKEARQYEIDRAARETGLTRQTVPLPVAIAWACTAMEKGEDVLMGQLRASPILGDDLVASVWWARRFLSVDGFQETMAGPKYPAMEIKE